MENLFEQLKLNISKYDNFIIMSHKKPDLDAFASSIGIYEVLKKYNKSAYIFMNDINELHSSVLEAINLYGGIEYINEQNYKKYLDDKTLLIILDVHQKDRLNYSEILDDVSDIIVIDHHIKSKNYIRNTKMFYNNTLASSISEIIVYLANYLNIKLSNIAATIMLAGIETDTNGYNLKTTSDTYLAASILMKLGADNILKQELLKETKEEYLKRADFIKNSYMLNSYTAICILNKINNANEDLSLIAEEMLKFENVNLAIAIGKLDKKVIGISAKSIGEIDACKLMKKFNGGGHFNNAAAQIENENIKNIIDILNNALEEKI